MLHCYMYYLHELEMVCGTYTNRGINHKYRIDSIPDANLCDNHNSI